MSVCPVCRYIGDKHLCGCVAKLGKALEAGDLRAAREQYESIVADANERLRCRFERDAAERQYGRVA